MPITLSDFKSNVKDVARPNRFMFKFNSLRAGGDPVKMTYLCKSSQIPGKNIGEVILNWQGMQNKIAGDPTFDDLTLTFLNDYDQSGRDTFEKWMKKIDDQTTNVRTEQEEYKEDCTLEHLGRGGEVIASFKMIGVWPKTIDPVDLDQETMDTPSEFNVTLSMDYWERES